MSSLSPPELELQGLPDAGVVAPEEALFGGEFCARFIASNQIFSGHDGAIIHEDGSADGAFVFSVGVRGKGAGPGDVAVAGGIESVAAFGKGPAGAGVKFAES